MPVPDICIEGQPIAESSHTRILDNRYVRSLGKAATRHDLTHQTIVQRLFAADEGDFLILPDAFPGCDAPDKVTITENNTLGKTKERSMHRIRFGQMVMQFIDDVPLQDNVACKPLPIPVAVRESALARHINTSESFRASAYVPLGYVKLDGSVLLVTRYKASLTFDNLLWSEDPDNVASGEQSKEALTKGAVSLATMHAMGYTHGDAQVKNITWDIEKNQPLLPDLESAKYHEGLSQRVAFELDALRDLDTLMRYLQKRPNEHVYDAVARKYIGHFYETTLEAPPITYEEIVGIRRKPLKQVNLL